MTKNNKKRVSVSSACSFCGNLTYSLFGSDVYICDDCKIIYNGYLLHKKDYSRKREGYEKIIRGLEIPLEYFEVAMIILSYVIKKLREKCGEDELTVSIQQKGLKLTLVIEAVFWRVKEIRKTMHEYSLVLCGRMSIDDFSKNKIEVLELKQRLKLVYAQLKNQQELLEIEKKQTGNMFQWYDEVICLLSDSLSYHYSERRDGLYKKILTDLTDSENIIIKYSSIILIKKIAEGIKQPDEYQVKTALELIANEDPSIIKKGNRSRTQMPSLKIGRT